jgi:OmcA/MtrC family decaheme c-type cytochrome
MKQRFSRGLEVGHILWIALASAAALGSCSNGEDGIEGLQGPPGNTGRRGETGETGDEGPEGETGESGEDGEEGPEGPPGDGAEWPENGLRHAGPGLVVEVESATIADDGTAVVEFSATDGEGRPLDREGLLTEGALSASFVLAYLEQDGAGESLQYQGYTLRSQTSPITDETETQVGTDTGGTYEALTPGHYRYTFGTNIAVADGDREKTHTLGVWVTRTYQAVRYVANETFSFLPAGGEPSVVRDVAGTAACENCHGRLEGHGGVRRGVEMCVLCHTDTNAIDPDTGNSIDFSVMVHKIHMGSSLPSVVGGDAYQLIGFQQAVHDFGEVVYPGEVTSCDACHTGEQGDRWNTRLSAKTCGSCHDRTYFEAGTVPSGWTAHSGGAHTDSECIVCHEENSLSPVREAHVNTINNPARHQVVVNLVAIENTAPTELPEVVLNVTVDGQPLDILATPMGRLRMYIAGPNTDYEGNWSENINTAPACGDPIVPPCIAVDGSNFRYHAAIPIPADATGSYTLGVEARIVDGALTSYAMNPTLAFAVTDSAAVPRREVVALESCNSCHQELAFHGGNRRTPEYCVMCHFPAFAEAELLEDESVTAANFNFKDIIHGLHAEAHMPDSVANCGHCHVGTSYGLPLAAGVAPSLTETWTCTEDPIDDVDTTCDTFTTATESERAPATAACVSCHAETDAIVHAEVNTSPTSGAEACGTCHGSGKSEDVAVVHAPAP